MIENELQKLGDLETVLGNCGFNSQNDDNKITEI